MSLEYPFRLTISILVLELIRLSSALDQYQSIRLPSSIRVHLLSPLITCFLIHQHLTYFLI